MILKRRVNCVFKPYPPYRDGNLVGVVTGAGEPDLVKWLGIVDRKAARRVKGGKEVALDFVAFQADLLSKTYWFPQGQYMVGCQIEDGALAVMDGSKPLLKRLKSEPSHDQSVNPLAPTSGGELHHNARRG